MHILIESSFISSTLNHKHHWYLMLIKALGSQRKEIFANQRQGFHKVMVLWENTVLFHSSHHSTSCRDTASRYQCHHGKTRPTKHPSQGARQCNTHCIWTADGDGADTRPRLSQITHMKKNSLGETTIHWCSRFIISFGILFLSQLFQV